MVPYLQCLELLSLLCRDDSGQPVVLKSVREAERRVSGSHFMGG